MMNQLEAICTDNAEHLDGLNAHIRKRLESDNPMMSDIVLGMLRTKGKQLRPLLLMMCARLFGTVTPKVLAAAAAVELLHNASLIHDDVVDNSPTRRGAPTVNAVWDNHIAVLVGDFFTSSAMNEAISTGDIAIIDALCRLGRDLSLGEIDQIYNARQHSIDIANYYRIIDYKTASLFVTSARMGCIAASAPADMTENLANYALLFGRCFQIRDDIFDYFPEGEVGKPTGNDLREGKITLPLLLALRSDAPGKAEIELLLAQDNLTDSEIARIQAFTHEAGGIDATYAEMAAIRTEAMQYLEPFDARNPIRRQLEQLFDFVIARRF